jgi:hypothetical protein
MARYRKKPVVIEAALFDGQLVGEPSTEVAGKVKLGTCPKWFPAVVPEWENFHGGGRLNPGDVVGLGGNLFIGTREGSMRADPGDWIICGVKGELYPCKPEIFALTYDRAD